MIICSLKNGKQLLHGEENEGGTAEKLLPPSFGYLFNIESIALFSRFVPRRKKRYEKELQKPEGQS